MSKFITDLGSDYFSERMRGAWFKRGDDILTVEIVRSDGVHCRALDGRDFMVPQDFFVGFDILEYPTMGYRRIGDNLIYLVSRAQGFRAGVRNENIIKSPSPLSAVLLQSVRQPGTSDFITSIFSPRYDTVDSLPELLSGTIVGLVLSSDIIIEPSVVLEGDHYDVFFRGSRVGSFSEDLTVQATSNKNTQFIRQVLANER